MALPLEWHGRVGNQFHLITCEGRDGNTGCVKGNLRSWTFFPDPGWIPSTHQRDGISHFESFGSDANLTDVTSVVEQAIRSEFSKLSWTNWEKLTEQVHELSYVRSTVALHVLKELADQLDFIVHGDDLQNIVLLRKSDE